MFITFPETDTIDLKNPKIFNAELGTLLNTKSSVYLRTEMLGKLSDWKKIYPVNTSIQFVDEFASQLFAVNRQVLLAGADGIEVNVEDNKIVVTGNLFYGDTAPSEIPDNKYDLVVYLNTSDNSIYFWNPIAARWLGPYVSYDFKEANYTKIDTTNNVVYLPKTLPNAKIKYEEKKALFAKLSGQHSASASKLKYSWSIVSGSATLSGEDTPVVTVIASAPNVVKVKLTVTDEANNSSYDTLDIIFSYYLQVQGPNNGESGFNTLGEAFAWIRSNDWANEKRYYIEVFNTTSETEEVLIPTQSFVHFKNGSINIPVKFVNGDFYWIGNNSINLFGNIYVDNAKVKLYNFDIASNADFSIYAKDSELTLDNVELRSVASGVQLLGGKLTIADSTLTTIHGSTLEILDAEVLIKDSNLLSYESQLTAIFINCNGAIEQSKCSQLNPDGIHTIEIATDLENKTFTLTNTSISTEAVMSDDNISSALSIKGIITVTLNNVSTFAKNGIAVLITNPDRVSIINSHFVGKKSLVINKNTFDTFEPNTQAQLTNVRGTYLIGEAVVNNIPRNNVYEL